MAVGTVMIGILPTYAAIGVAAPLLLLIARLLQGFSAGGEWGSSTAYIVEWAPAGQRGWYGSFQQTSVVMGLLLGSGIAALFATILTTEQMDGGAGAFHSCSAASWDPWACGCGARSTRHRPTRSREAPRPSTEDKTSPWLMAGRAFGFTIVWTVCFYVLLNYMPTWSRQYLKISPAAALWANTIGLFVLMVFIPVMGKLSDKWGRKPLLLACCLAYIVLPYPIFKYLVGGASYMELIAVQILFAILISMFSGPGPAAIAEIFPTRTRSTWMTSGYALAVAIFGGFAPFISVWLISTFNSPIAHSFYLIAAAIVSTIVIATLRETAHEPLGAARKMLITFDGKRVIVAGAARGIGHAIAVAFAENGGKVTACDRLFEEVEHYAGPAKTGWRDDPRGQGRRDRQAFGRTP